MREKIKLQANDSISLREAVFLSIKDAILTGQLSPGERLPEIGIAQQLGVSRTPVREAIRKLELEGLVRTIPCKGAQVAQISRSEAQEVLELREALESLAARKACRQITSSQLKRLRETKREFEQKLMERDLDGSARLDEQFHEVISEAAGSRRLVLALDVIRGQAYRLRLEDLKNPAGHQELIREHGKICEAIERGDEEKAVQEIRRHLERQLKGILANFDQA